MIWCHFMNNNISVGATTIQTSDAQSRRGSQQPGTAAGQRCAIQPLDVITTQKCTRGFEGVSCYSVNQEKVKGMCVNMAFQKAPFLQGCGTKISCTITNC